LGWRLLDAASRVGANFWQRKHYPDVIQVFNEALSERNAIFTG
jgi:hypothetical protein